MHLRTQVHTLFYQADLLFILIVALGNDGLDKRHRSLIGLSCRLHTQQFPQPHTVVTSVWRKEMHGLSFGAYLIYIILQFAHRQGLRDTHHLGLFSQRGLGTRPDDIVDGQLVAKHNLAVFIDIDDSRQTRIIESEEIEEGRVLTEAVGIVGIVHAHLIVTQEEQQSATHVLLQLCPAAEIG